MRIEGPEIGVYFSLGVSAVKMMVLMAGKQIRIPGRLVFNGSAITKCCLLWFDARLVL